MTRRSEAWHPGGWFVLSRSESFRWPWIFFLACGLLEML